ncbi:RNA polymerase factor sigma-54 [Alloiococcus sp. CFN-8]|uniref:RNA polymerase factor sigma-54 n=1 Tax=Alloiococcus sp. CFN-8 TaxID=3416081 RepID=UPI003CF91B12
MKLDYNLNLTQEQKLIMTQSMQLSIKLLQMSTVELKEYIDKEFAENPTLEVKYEDLEDGSNSKDKLDYKEMIKYLEFDSYGSQNYSAYDQDSDISPFTFISSKKSLKEYLIEQLREQLNDKELIAISSYIIEGLDERGYLTSSIEDLSDELKLPQKSVQAAIRIIQSLDPVGIGARDLKECLKLQLLRKNCTNEKLYSLVEDHLESLADNKYPQISKELNITLQEAQELGDIVKSLEPKPSRGFYTGEDVKYIIPDAIIKKLGEEYVIIMNDGVLPRLSINPIYKELITTEKDKEAVAYVKDKLDSALFLIKSIESRRSTLYKVLEKVIEKQKDFFDKGDNYLRPMTLKDIATELDIHESTVSRAIREKYILTDRKTIKIKDVFSSGIQKNRDNEDVAVISIKNKIKVLIEEEDKGKPLSDQGICDILNKMGFNISRRTVAKYREELGIKSSSKRKRF